jgi:hypothetical protein
MKKRFTFYLSTFLLLGGACGINAQTSNTYAGQGTGANNTGNFNTAMGYNALSTGEGSSNSAFGFLTLVESSGGYNCAFGNGSLKANNAGELNAAFGTRALESNESGSRNIAIGHRTLGSNVAGFGNTSIGYSSLLSVEGSGNVALGYYSPRHLVSGDYNTFLGTYTAENLISGSYNTFLGKVAVAVGPSEPALAGNNTNSSIILADGRGKQKLFISGDGNVGIGLANNIIPTNRLDVNGGVAIGVNYVSKNLPIPSLGAKAPANGLLVEGNVGIGNISPKNKVEITQGTAGNSGLRFTNLTSNFTPPASLSNGKCLSVNENGDVVLQNLPNGSDSNQLSSSGNTLTSTVNNNTATAPIVNSVSNTINASNQLITTVNGVSSQPLNLPSGNYTPQVLTQTENTITLSNGGGSFTLPTFVDTNTDAQTLALNGNILAISNGNSVVLPAATPQTLTQSGNTVTLSNGGGSFTLPTTSVIAGNNATVTGTGTAANPFVVNAIDKSIYSTNGIINAATTTNGNRIVGMNGSNIWFKSLDTETNGKIYIGTNATYPTTTGSYRLFVEGGIMTEKVKVSLRSSANWADYVFEDNYKLMPLQEVSKYVAANKHLPGVDSAKELAENGLDLAAMQSKHMEKIEELTLYIIEQDKKIEAQNQALDNTNKEIEALKLQVKALIEKSK